MEWMWGTAKMDGCRVLGDGVDMAERGIMDVGYKVME